MDIKKAFRLFALTALAASVVACDGDAGPAGPPGGTGEQGDQGDQGEQGDPGDPAPGEPSINGVTPGVAYLERVMDVTISGFGTEFSAPNVDFGPGITVDNVAVASGTGVIATITIAADAALGARDITVSEGGVDYVYAGAFTVEAPISFTVLEGSFQQGGIVFARVDMLDESTPFDTSLDGLATDVVTPGIYTEWYDLTPYAADVIHFVDLNATPGMTDFVIDSAADGFLVTSRAPAAVEITATTPTVLTVGTPSTIAAPAAGGYETIVAEVTFGANVLGNIEVTAATVDPNADPFFYILPASGTWSGAIKFGTRGVFGLHEIGSGAAGDKFYIVAQDGGDLDGYDIQIDTWEGSTDEVEPNDCPNAQDLGALSSPVVLANLTLNGAGDEDWFQFTIDQSAVDNGFGVNAATFATSGISYDTTDTEVAVFKTCTVPYGPASDEDTHEDHYGPAFNEPGTYYVRVRQSQDGTFTLSYDLYVGLDLGVGPVPPLTPTATDTETEPNDAYAMGSAAAGDAVVGYGEIFPAGDVDFWAITPATTGTMTVTVTDGEHFSCLGVDNNIDSYIEIFDTNGTSSLATDEDGGVVYCSEATASVTGGSTYYVEVKDCQDAGCSPGTLEFDYSLEATTN